MNYKLEKFWNSEHQFLIDNTSLMNYKLEKFWNVEFEDKGIHAVIDEL